MKQCIRRMISIFCIMVITISTVGVFHADASTYENYYVTTVACHIRSGEGTNFSIVASEPEETRLRDYNSSVITSDVWEYNQNWTHIKKVGVYSGYIRNDLICPVDRAYSISTSSVVNLREDHYTTSQVKCTLSNGIVVVKQKNTTLYYGSGYWWRKVLVMTGPNEGYTGYVVINYMTSFGS